MITQRPAARLARLTLLGCLLLASPLAITTLHAQAAVTAPADSGLESSEARELPEDQRSYSPLTKQAEDYWNAGKYKQARKTFALVEKRSLSSRERAHAILAQGDCYLKQGNHWKAFGQYRKAIDNYASFIPYNKVLQVEFDMADKYYSSNKKRLGLIPYSTREKAIEIFDHLVQAAPYSPLASKSLYNGAQLALSDKNYQGAIDRLTDLVTKYPKSSSAADARVDLAKILLDYAEIADGDGALSKTADAELDRFLTLFPDHPRVEEAKALKVRSTEIEAKRLLYLGEFYQRPAHRRLPASSRYLNEVLTTYRDSESAEAAEGYIERLHAISAATGESVPNADGTLPVAAPRVGGALLVTLPDGTQGIKGDKPGEILPLLDGTQKSDKWLLPIVDLYPERAKPAPPAEPAAADADGYLVIPAPDADPVTAPGPTDAAVPAADAPVVAPTTGDDPAATQEEGQ